MKKYIIITVTLLAMGASTAWANDGNQQHGHMHEMMKNADANHDDKVTSDEFIAVATMRAKKMFKHMDANNDGVLDEKDHESFFDKMDANHDNSISHQEFKAFHQKMKQKHHDKGAPHG